MKPRLWIPAALLLSSLACVSPCSFLESGQDALEKAGDVATQVSELAVELEGLEELSELEELEELEPSSGDEEGATDEDQSALGFEADALSQLDSYRVRTAVRWIGSDAGEEDYVIEQEHTRDPLAHRVTIQGEQGDVEMVEIGDATWMCGDGSCVQTGGGEAFLQSTLEGLTLDEDELVADQDATYVTREEVNGIQAEHYSLDPSAAGAILLARGQITDAEADVWIADTAGLPRIVVRYRVSWEETRDGVDGSAEYHYDLYDINAPSIQIEPPEGASPGPAEDIPSYEGATDVTSMEGFLTFSTTDDGQTVAEFYRTELPAHGWMNETDDDLGQTISQEWSKDGRALSLIISEGDEETSVVISEEEAE